jgi:hypothetical protein
MLRSRLAAAVAVALAASLAIAVMPAKRAEAAAPLPRVSSDGFTFRAGGQPFVPRGLNYVRLAQTGPEGPFHSVFEPGRYSPTDADHMLQFMQMHGYNVVRVFIDAGGDQYLHGIGRNPGEGGLNQDYLGNVEWFIRAAINRGIYVMPVFDSFPHNAFYRNTYVNIGGRPTNPQVDDLNLLYMDYGHVLAKQAYLWYFVNAMRGRLTPAYLSAIFAYELDNEVFWYANHKPFNTPNVMLDALDGGPPYNMADFADVGRGRQDAADDSLAYYARTVAGSLVGPNGIDPDGMVTMGFGTNQYLGRVGFVGLPGHCSGTGCKDGVDYRYPGRPAKVQNYLSFIDMHTYPQGGTYTIRGDLESSEVQWFARPYLLGELGATKAVYGNNVRIAAVDMKNKQVNSCSVDGGAKGWLFWTYDSDIIVPNLASQGLFYSLASEGGAINALLAPSQRPNPCVP